MCSILVANTPVLLEIPLAYDFVDTSSKSTHRVPQF